MTRFTDGPLAGKVLCLARAPLYLRAVLAADGSADALDQPDDAPEPGEAVYACRRVGEVSTCHVDGRDRDGRRFGRWYRGGEYALAEPQPDAATLRDGARWRAWCEAQIARGATP